MQCVCLNKKICDSPLHKILCYVLFRYKLLITPYGYDDNNWDPSKDRFLPVTYSIESMKGKVACKNILRQRLKFSGLSSAVVSSRSCTMMTAICFFPY